MQSVTAPVTGWWQKVPAKYRPYVGYGFLGVMLLVYPLLDYALKTGTIYAFSDAMIYIMLALGLNIVVGFAGLLDLGYAAFFAIGAYGLGIFASPIHGFLWYFWVAIWIAAAFAAISGVLLGSTTLRLRGDYLAIVTLGFGEIIPIVVRNLDYVTIQIGPWTLLQNVNITGGENGINPVNRPTLPFIANFGVDAWHWYFLILAVMGVVIFVITRMHNSRMGRAWMAIREDEMAASAMGVNPFAAKLWAFAMGASFSGFGGALYAAKLQAITPSMFVFQTSIMLLVMVILGGMGNIKGVILGGFLITIFDRVILSESTAVVNSLGNLLGIDFMKTADLTLSRWLLFGIALVILMILRPEGLWPSRARRAEMHEEELPEEQVSSPPPPATVQEAAEI